MPLSIQAILEIVQPHVPKGLVSSSCMESMGSLCRLLPLEITHGLGFESRLGDAEPGVDLILRSPAGQGQRILGAMDRTHHVPHHFYEDRIWSTIKDFCEAWSDPAAGLRGPIQSLWLEFDRDRLDLRVPTPGVCFIQVRPAHGSTETYQHVAKLAYRYLKGSEIPGATYGNLTRCFESLEGPGAVIQIGFALARGSRAVRIVVRGLAPEAMGEYLERVAWRGDRERLDALVQSIAGFVSYVNLNFDIDANIATRIGLESFITCEPIWRSDSRWVFFLDFLVNRGWCTPEKAAAFLEWPGLIDASLPGENWSCQVSKFFSHIKISLNDEGSVDAKGYCGFIWREAFRLGGAL